MTHTCDNCGTTLTVRTNKPHRLQEAAHQLGWRWTGPATIVCGDCAQERAA